MFKLFVILPEEKSDNERFFLIYDDACIVYREKAPKNSVEIKIEDLPDFGKAWVEQCKGILKQEELKAKSEQLLKEAHKFYMEFKTNIKQLKENKNGETT